MGLYEHLHSRNNETNSENLDLLRSMIGPEKWVSKKNQETVKETKPNSKFSLWNKTKLISLCMKPNKTHKSLYMKLNRTWDQCMKLSET